MERTVWTDERLDDAIARIEHRFDRVDRQLERIDARFDALQRLLVQIGFGLAGALVALVAAIIASS